MNKKAFTIIEMLAIIVVLGILLIVIAPNIIGISDKEKETKYDQLLNHISLASELHISNNIKNPIYPIKIKLQNLIDAKLLSTPLINPITNVELDYNMYYTIDRNPAGKIEISGPYQYDTAGANEPSIQKTADNKLNGLIPVYWDNTASVWKKAPADNTNLLWFDYSQKLWANAVTVTNTNRASYLNALVGTTIAEADINTMWVWIPRYAYKITKNYNISATGTIEIEFLKNDKNYGKDGIANYIKPKKSTEVVSELEVGTITPEQTTGLYVSGVQQKWIVHPAFTFGDKEVSGMWVAKFKASFDADDDIQIKPFVDIPITYIDNMHLKSRNMEKSTKYGWTLETGTLQTSGDFTSNDNNLNTHFIKNTEWGAVVYLTHSKYGIGTSNIACNNYAGKTGYGNSSRSSTVCVGTTNIGVDTFPYTDPRAYNTSTTANITGVYEMSGGMWEYTGGHYYNKTAPNIVTYSSAFVASDLKYRDVYDITYSTFKKGDAMLEMGNANADAWLTWYRNVHSILTTSFVIPMRSPSPQAAEFHFGDVYIARCTGGETDGCNLSFRPVILPTD